MAQEKEEWSEVETKAPEEPKVEYEVEGEEDEKVETPSPVEAKEEVKPEEVPKEDSPPELEGVDISPTSAGHWVENPILPDQEPYNPTLVIRHTKTSDFGITDGPMAKSLILGGRYLIMPYSSRGGATELK